jgi:hypothetical protein
MELTDVPEHALSENVRSAPVEQVRISFAAAVYREQKLLALAAMYPELEPAVVGRHEPAPASLCVGSAQAPCPPPT